MPLPRVRSMTKEEEESSGRPQLVPGQYYPGVITRVDFFRNKEGRIVGLRPTKPVDGKSAHPNGQMRIMIEVKLDGFDQKYTIGIPLPWDERKAPPWNGPHDASGNPMFDDDGKALGQANTFTDEEAAKYARPLRTGGQMKNKLAVLAEKFGWTPFRVYPVDVMIDENGDVVTGKDGRAVPVPATLPEGVSVVKAGQPISQWLDLDALLTGKRVMLGEIKSENGRYTDTDLIPSEDGAQEPSLPLKPGEIWFNELVDALRGEKLGNGEPFTYKNVLEAVKGRDGLERVGPNILPDMLSEAEWHAIGDILAVSAIERGITPPSKYMEHKEVKGL